MTELKREYLPSLGRRRPVIPVIDLSLNEREGQGVR